LKIVVLKEIGKGFEKIEMELEWGVEKRVVKKM
jgi:hypothetical protein